MPAPRVTEKTKIFEIEIVLQDVQPQVIPEGAGPVNPVFK